MYKKIIVQADNFDLNYEIEKLHAGNKSIGAIVSFTGWCRDENGTLKALEIEHYADMAKKNMALIVDEAASRFPLNGVTIIHRYGIINVGEQIVLVITASTHRIAAFEAANFIMDYLKTNAPFWKKEITNNSNNGDWVHSKEQDEKRKQNWSIAKK